MYDGKYRNVLMSLEIDMNAENMDRRNFLKTCAFTTGVVGLSLEEKALLAQETKAKEAQAARRLHRPADGPDRQAQDQPAHLRRQSDQRLRPRPRHDLYLRVAQALLHRREDHADLGDVRAVRHQYDDLHHRRSLRQRRRSDRPDDQEVLGRARRPDPMARPVLPRPQRPARQAPDGHRRRARRAPSSRARWATA